MSILKTSGIAVTDPKNNLTFPRVDAFSALFIEIGEISVNYNWLTVSLKRKFTNPVVVAKPMGSSDTRMQEEERNNQIHATETLGFIAWLPTSSTSASQYYVDGKIFQVARTSTVVTDAFYRISFNSAISRTGRIPVFLADMQTKNGSGCEGSRGAISGFGDHPCGGDCGLAGL